MAVSEQLKEALLEQQSAGKSLYSISKEAGISLQILSRFLSGERSQIRSETSDRLCEYLGLELQPKRATTSAKPKKRR